MIAERITVYLPCHSLDDFPTWLEGAEVDDLLSAWTAAWDPRLIAAVGRMPEWASVDLPPHDPHASLGLVPAFADDRFLTQTAGLAMANAATVRGVTGRDAIVAAALAAVGLSAPPPALTADFYALGLAWLLGELLARRMRSHAEPAASDFAAALMAAARAAVAGDEAAARERIAECFTTLEGVRSHYYPVDVWLLDLVLLADSTLGPALDCELASPVPMAVVATGQMIEALASRNPQSLAAMRGRREAGTLAGVGGRFDARPLDLCLRYEIEESFARGKRAWAQHLGAAPTTFGQIAGGWSPCLPHLLGSAGYRGVIFTLFDGTPLPDPAASRIIWEGTGGAAIDGLARPPIDVRDSRFVLHLPGRIGDAMDRDHAVIVSCAHYPGTASPWFDDLRRIASWSSVFGRFATPEEILERTAQAGVVVRFKADAYPVTLPLPTPGIRDQVASQQAIIRQALGELAVSPPAAAAPAPPAVVATPAPGLLRRFFGGGGGDQRLVLENGLVRVKVHEATGSILSLRAPGDRGNRISQRLSVRTTRPAPAAGQPWESVAERAVYAAMRADRVVHSGAAIESHGRLVGADEATMATFRQTVRLIAGRPLVVIDMEVQTTRPFSGPPLESYAACRFAWHENQMPDISRSLHLEAVETERWAFTAPHFIEIIVAGSRADQSPTTLVTCGLPWHVRTSEHMLDTILPADERPAVPCRIVIGVGSEKPADLALEFAR